MSEVIRCKKCDKVTSLTECAVRGHFRCPDCHAAFQPEQAQQESAPTQEKPMNHAELVKEARELADRLDKTIVRGELDNHFAIIEPAAPTLHALADIVERQDVSLVESGKAIVDATNHKAELVAACVACDVKIKVAIAMAEGWHIEPLSRFFSELHAVRDLMERAAKLAEPADHVDATLAEATAKHRDLLKRLADDPATNRAADPFTTEAAPPIALEMCVRQIGEGILCRGYWIACPVGILDTLSSDRETTRKIGDRWLAALGVAKPTVEVELRVTHTTTGEWSWKCQLGERCFIADFGHPFPFSPSAELARKDGIAWLAALGKQLGVKLVAVWKEGG